MLTSWKFSTVRRKSLKNISKTNTKNLTKVGLLQFFRVELNKWYTCCLKTDLTKQRLFDFTKNFSFSASDQSYFWNSPSLKKHDCITYLWNYIQIWNQCTLKNDWDIWGVEQFDWVRAVLTTVTSRLDGQIDSESL